MQQHPINISSLATQKRSLLFAKENLYTFRERKKGKKTTSSSWKKCNFLRKKGKTFYIFWRRNLLFFLIFSFAKPPPSKKKFSSHPRRRRGRKHFFPSTIRRRGVLPTHPSTVTTLLSLSPFFFYFLSHSLFSGKEEEEKALAFFSPAQNLWGGHAKKGESERKKWICSRATYNIFPLEFFFFPPTLTWLSFSVLRRERCEEGRKKKHSKFFLGLGGKSLSRFYGRKKNFF